MITDAYRQRRQRATSSLIQAMESLVVPGGRMPTQTQVLTEAEVSESMLRNLFGSTKGLMHSTLKERFADHFATARDVADLIQGLSELANLYGYYCAELSVMQIESLAMVFIDRLPEMDQAMRDEATLFAICVVGGYWPYEPFAAKHALQRLLVPALI
jgi:hypothetical protein